MIHLNGSAITLRKVAPNDEGFLYSVYASTRAGEMKLVDWPEPQKEAFLRMQFNAQHQYYSENYPNAQFQIILMDGLPVGRLYLDRRAKEIRIIDIALLPEHCSRGIGSALLREILNDGRRSSLPVTIHVERFNPALQLYKRLGFCFREDKGVYYFLEWLPEGRKAVEDGKRTDQ